jgi:replicative DNA helicase
MLENQLLKLSLNRSFWQKNGAKLNKLLEKTPLRSITTSIAQLHQIGTQELLRLPELKTYHFVENPALTKAQRSNLEVLFDDIEESEEVSEEVGTVLVRKLANREEAREVAELCVEVLNGERDDLERIRRRVDQIDSDTSSSDALKPVTDEIEEILKAVEGGVRWEFNIPTLKEKITGIGPGLFSIFAARPEVGKTAFWVSLAFGPSGFTSQGAKVAAIINEEPAVRTKARALSACTGKTLQEIKDALQETKIAYDSIKEKGAFYDAVGISFSDLNEIAGKVDILVIDQLDKVRVDGDFNSSHERLREIYTQARELAKAHQIAVIGISQLSADAEARLIVDYSMLEGSKTGKAAEADLIICIGNNPAQGDKMRMLNLSKNKITGDHSSIMCTIRPEISRYDV